MQENIKILTSVNGFLSRYFDMIDGCGHIRKTSVYKTPYQCNILEKYDSKEPFTSWAIIEILKYCTNDNQNILLKSFAERFLSGIGFNPDNVKSPLVIAEQGRIDICIKEKEYCIIIENKLKGAVFQQNQLARYINICRKDYADEKIFIVILSKDDSDNFFVRKSVWMLPEDFDRGNGCRMCSVDKYQCLCDLKDSELTEVQHKIKQSRCEKCISFYNDFKCRSIVINSQLADWFLNDCLNLVPEKEYILKSFIIQLADFLKLQFKTRESEQLKREMKEYLREKLRLSPENRAEHNLKIIEDGILDLERLTEDLKNLREEEYGRQIMEWYNSLKSNPDFSQVIKTDGKSFGILIKGIWCGCWYKDNLNSHPYWGFYKEGSAPNEEDTKMVVAILADCGMENDGKNEGGYVRWDNTDDGLTVCTKFYYSALQRGFI